MDNVLAVRGLVKTYPGGVEALRGVDLTLGAGEFVAVVGSSGAGKSTLLHCCGGLDTPTAGEVDVTGRIGFVFQFHHLLPELTALENVVFAGRLAGLHEDEADTRARGLLDRLGLSGRLEHRPGELSGGEQQRVAVARAVINRPAVILADEPTGNLDQATGMALAELFRTLNRESGTGVLVATHQERLAKWADRVIRMVDGRVEATG